MNRCRPDTVSVVQVSVAAVASNDVAVREEEIARTVRQAESALRGGRDTLVMTSRKLVTGSSEWPGRSVAGLS